VVELDEGAGPRHLDFSPDGKSAFVANPLAIPSPKNSWGSRSIHYGDSLYKIFIGPR
jgi:hypothetical protein